MNEGVDRKAPEGSPEAKVAIRITTPYGEEVAALEGKTAAGLNSIPWDMRRTQGQTPQGPSQGGPPAGRGMVRLVPPGEYVVVLEIGDKKWTKRTTIRKMPGLD